MMESRKNAGASLRDRAGGPADLSRCASQPKALIACALEIAPHLDPNIAGELLRELCFAGDEYGCYGTFDLVDGFEEVPPETLSLVVRTALAGCWAKDPATVRQMSAFVHRETGLGVAWYWDGDGTLVFKRGDLFIYNGDCKKDHGWEASAPGDWIHTYEHYEVGGNYPDDAIATEAQRAATGNTDAVEDEGAGPKDIAQKAAE